MGIIALMTSGCASKGFMESNTRCKDVDQLGKQMAKLGKNIETEKERQHIRVLKIRNLFSEMSRLETEKKVAEMECQQAFHEFRMAPTHDEQTTEID